MVIMMMLVLILKKNQNLTDISTIVVRKRKRALRDKFETLSIDCSNSCIMLLNKHRFYFMFAMITLCI